MNTELNKFLERSKKYNDPLDRRIDDARKRTCTAEHLRAYEFSPPTMKKVCDYWTGKRDVVGVGRVGWDK